MIPNAALKGEASASSSEPDWDAVPTGDAPVAGPDAAAAGEGSPQGPGVSPALLTKDDFYAMFEMAFHFPNAVIARPPFPLEALPIREGERVQARAASDAIYDIALEVPALRWLLEPESPWIQRAVPIIMFLGMKAAAVRSELRAKRAKPVEPVETPKQEPEAEPAGPDGPAASGPDMELEE